MSTTINNIDRSILKRYQAIRQQTMQLCKPLSTEDYVVQPVVDVSPPKWHLGHTTWFFENFILAPNVKDYKIFNEQLNWFFNSYYESQGPRINRALRGNMTRPSVQTVFAYREYVDQHLAQFLENISEKVDTTSSESDLLKLVEVGLQHEQQHQELLVTDIKYILGNNPLFPAYQLSEKEKKNVAQKLEFIDIQEGIYKIGFEGDGFCWDNEQAAHKVYLEKYSIANRLVTNGEYLAFIEAGGYDNHEYWLSEGWEWVKNMEVKAPLYWFKKDNKWQQYNLTGGIQDLDVEAPVTHMNYFEADAFAAWSGHRLPTEFEWETACKILQPSIPTTANFLEKNSFNSSSFLDTKDFQFYGQAWEWTASSYLPYPRYPRFKGALGEYNGKFMINQMVLRGGSCATPISHIRPTYRNFFQTDKRWQFTGIRLVKNN